MVLIANPQSGSATGSGDVAETLRAHGAAVEEFAIDDVEDARGALAEYDRLVVAGGDGSLGPVARLAAEERVPLAVVPTGTANDFARAMGLPLDPDEACALAARPDAATRRVELAWAGDRPFLNAASTGLSVVAAREAHAYKKVLGPLAYALGALHAGLTARPVRARVTADGEEAFSGRAWQIVVGGTGHFGGGSRVDAADPSDGKVDATIVEAGSRVRLVQHAYGMRQGHLASQGGVRHVVGRRLEIEVDQEFNVDGEVCRLQRPSVFTADEGAIEVVVAS